MTDDAYELTAADRERFLEEMALGMVAPQSPHLSQAAEPVQVEAITSERIQKVVRRLLMVASSQQRRNLHNRKRRTLVGLAAPQIGEQLRMIVVDTTIKPDRKKPGTLECFINPEIVWRTRETAEDREGCFSTGPVWGLVRRSVAVKVRALTPEGKPVERIFENFTARIVQHEIDHLDGIRFPERIKTDRKRHWVHTEELADYPKRIRHWPRTVTRQQWEQCRTGGPMLS